MTAKRQVLRTEVFSRNEGKFSVWFVLFNNLDIRNMAKNHPAHLTYKPVEAFRVKTSILEAQTTEVYIERLAAIRDLNSGENRVTMSATAKIVEEYDENGNELPSNVVFVADRPIVIAATDNDPKTTYTYGQPYTVFGGGYKTNAFYRLFDDIIRGGMFATVAGDQYVDGKTPAPCYTEDDVEEVQSIRKELREQSKLEYDEKYKVINAERDVAKAEKAKKREEEKKERAQKRADLAKQKEEAREKRAAEKEAKLEELRKVKEAQAEAQKEAEVIKEASEVEAKTSLTDLVVAPTKESKKKGSSKKEEAKAKATVKTKEEKINDDIEEILDEVKDEFEDPNAHDDDDFEPSDDELAAIESGLDIDDLI